MKTRTRALLLLAGAMATPAARAWDEDTCAPSVDPTCASPSPLQGNQADIDFDHSTAHWEMTWLMARCVGIDGATAAALAAADEATDMSSPACGSSVANNNNMIDYQGQFYQEGYACGYELSSAQPERAASAVPAYEGALRFSQTDRCRSVKNGASSSLHGHSEYFHYPYWRRSDDASRNSLSLLQAWAGTAATLVDPADRNCDLAEGATSNPCAASQALTLSRYGNRNERVCQANGANAGWRMPRSYPGAGAMDADRALRYGIYLHALADSYSHLTCQRYSGQTVTDGVVLVPADGEPTNHANFDDSGARCSALTGSSAHTQEQCNAACRLASHDCEFGDSTSTDCADEATTADLRSATVDGLGAVWNALATYRGRTARDGSTSTVQSWRSMIIRSFASYHDASARQQYVRDWATAAGETPCNCANGVYDWVNGRVTVNPDGTTASTPGYCATLERLAVSQTPSGAGATELTLTAGSSAQLYAQGTFRKQFDGTTYAQGVTRDVSWSSDNAAVLTVDNAGRIGRATAVAAGSATVTITRLGVTATVRVTVR